MALDPVTLAVLKGRLEQIADEMDATLFRLAFNPTIAEAHDACHGIYDATTGATLVQGKGGLPIFVGVMAFAVGAVIEKFAGARAPREGDVFIFNDPYLGGHASVGHAADPAGVRGRTGVLLAGQRGALARCGRRGAGQLQSGGDRVFPGGRPDPAGAADARGGDGAGHPGHRPGRLAPAGERVRRPATRICRRWNLGMRGFRRCWPRWAPGWWARRSGS